MEELLAAAALSMNAPASMVERSAQARAAASGASVEDVLRAWAGDGDIVASGPTAPPSEPETPAAAPAEAAPAPVPAPAAAVGPMDEAAMIAAAAEKMGMPESMVKRSAAARAKAQGVDVDAVLMEWAGVEGAGAASAAAVPVAAAAAAAPEASAPTPVSAEVIAEPDVEVLGSMDEVASPAPVEAPDAFESEEDAAAAGAFPRWLAAVFVLIPVFAISYALFLPNGPNCGDAGSLAVDPVTGLAVNCDLSEFGAEFVDFFSLGAETYQGIGCAACHGPGGGGVANFPAFTGGELLATFPEGSCSAQIDWISLGTAGWPESTYGANAKPVGGSGAIMPGLGGALTPEEVAAVALYERVAFGGQDLDAALADCGLVTEDASAALTE